jgi:hypothetical protein
LTVEPADTVTAGTPPEPSTDDTDKPDGLSATEMLFQSVVVVHTGDVQVGDVTVSAEDDAFVWQEDT